jgi:ABC-type multidrug transport system fused ATPase/permease subunit
MRSALDAAIPSDLRRLLRTAGARLNLLLGVLLMVLSALGLVAAPWLIGKAVNDLQRGSTDSTGHHPGSLLSLSSARSAVAIAAAIRRTR